MSELPERDWRLMSKLKPDLLNQLCARVHQQVRKLLDAPMESEHARYLSLCKLIRESDEVIVNCMDDWRRSQLYLRLIWLRREGLLTDEHVRQLSEAGQRLIDGLAEIIGDAKHRRARDAAPASNPDSAPPPAGE